MAGDITQVDEAPEPDWGGLEELLSDFAQLAKSDIPLRGLAQELIDCIINSLAPVGAAVWAMNEQGALDLVGQQKLDAVGSGSLAEFHRRLVREAMLRGRAELLSPGQALEGVANSTEFTLILVPVLIDQDAAGLVEVIQRPSISADAQEGNLRFIALLAELLAEYLRRGEVRNLRKVRRLTDRFAGFLLALHGTLDPKLTATKLANEGRRLIECDRLTVAFRRGRRFRLAAVSGVEAIHRASVAVKRLEKLVTHTATLGEAFWYESEQTDDQHPPQIERDLSSYLDESQTRTIGVIPLQAPSADGQSALDEVLGALIIEDFSAPEGKLTPATALAVARHGAVALNNAFRYHRLPTLPFLRSRDLAQGEPTRHWLKIFLGLVLIVAMGSTFFFTADFDVYAEGELQPTTRYHIYAPRDGQIAVVSVAHGEAVEAGATLVELSSPELDLEIQKIQGEHDAILQRSAAIESALLDYSSSVDPESIQINRLTAEQEELRQLFASQKERLAVLRRQRDMLTVQSPASGDVLTWETDKKLTNRPVRRGQRLLTIADLEGPWEAELRVPDDRIGPLLEFMEAADGPVEATFELATQRGIEYRGEVLRIARRTEVDAENRSIVRAALRVDRSSLVAPRPGGTIYAKIHCGQRSLFYVWCHAIIERLEGWLRF